MNGFRQFIETSVKTEIQDALNKIPKKHKDLLKGYKFKFHDGCTLKGHKDAIGMIHLNDDEKKEIHVAAPWNYGRNFAMMHEIAHLVYEKYMKDNDKLKKKWSAIVKKTKPKLIKLDKNVAKQNEEEIFCHSYANYYVNNKILKFSHDSWAEFIKNLPQD